ncbi:chain-length determining protein [Polymorphobacter glacialis]|uniref:Chain-length determining protein n=1 Tax=Sandarakinorhabdus glacialis TaxID=1614636 RepID=A0A916ZVD3_9SPHN|nr:polysaccharide biosynthesis tyrosine autokinase [Polymorphobacter glacialis]GGE14588.1 chain-length determining protein [Polymorphobacter glacialis]
MASSGTSFFGSRAATGFDAHPAASQSHTTRPAAHVGAGDVWNILVRRRLVVLLTLATVVAGVMLFLLRATPLYTATTTLQVTSQGIEEVATGELRPGSPLDELRISTHMNLLTAAPLGVMVVKDMQLDIDPEFAPVIEKPWYSRYFGTTRRAPVLDAEDAEAQHMGGVVERLFDRVKIDRIGQSHLIEVAVTTVDPEKSARIANSIAGSHLKRLQKEARSETARRIAETELRADELRQQAVDGERAAVAYSRSRGVAARGPADTANTGQIDRLSAQLAEARAARVGAEIRIASAGASTGTATSPLLNDLRSQMATLDKRIAELQSQFGAGHPDMIAATAQRSDVAGRLAIETARVQGDARADVAANRAREGQIASDLGSVRAEAVRAGDASVSVDDLRRSAEANRALYLTQLAQLQELRSRERVIRPDVTIVGKAIAGADPSEPRTGRIIGVAAVAGSMLALLFAFAAEMLDNRLRTADQVAEHIGLDTLAMMPELGRKDMRIPITQLFTRQPNSIFVEASRALYMDIVERLPMRGGCIVITSPLPSDGKTLIAASLAAAAATLGRRAVLVDFDLRRPTVLETLSMSAGSGDLVDCLMSERKFHRSELDAIIQANDDLPRLSVVGVTRVIDDPSAALSSPRVGEIIGALRERFDLVILNAPPILAVRDAKGLSVLANQTLLVIRWGHTTPEIAKAARRLLGGIVPLAVISRVDFRRHSAARYGDQLQHFSDFSSYFGVPATQRQS